MISALENVLVQIPHFIFLKNTRLEYITCNANFANSVDLCSPESIYGKTDFDMPWADSHAELYRDGDLEVLDGDAKFNYIETQLKKNGGIISILITKTPLLDADGNKIGVIGSYMEAMPKELLGKFDHCKINFVISQHQADFLYYAAQGLSLAQIAERIEVPISIINSHLNILLNKLNCDTYLALQKKALTLDIIKRRLLGFEACVNDLFTKREMDIIQNLKKGKTAKGIAAELRLSHRTIENKLAIIKQKMNVTSKYELVEKIIDLGM